MDYKAIATAILIGLTAPKATIANEVIIRDYYHEMSCLNPGTIETIENVGQRLMREFPAIDRINLLVMNPLEERDEWRHFKQAINDLKNEEIGGIFILTCKPYRTNPRRGGLVWEPYLSNQMGMEVLAPMSEF